MDEQNEQITYTIPVSIGVPFYLLQSIDYFAKEANTSRSKYIVKILKEKLEKQKWKKSYYSSFFSTSEKNKNSKNSAEMQNKN